MGRQQGLETAVPLVHKIKATFLYPAVEIALRDLVRVVEHTIVGGKNLYRSFLHGNSAPAHLRRERGKVPTIKVPGAGIVLHNQSASGRNEIQKLLIAGGDVFLGIVGANAENDRSVACQIFAG